MFQNTRVHNNYPFSAPPRFRKIDPLVYPSPPPKLLPPPTIKFTSATKLFFAVKQPLMCN